MTNGSIDIDDRHGDVSGVINDLFKNSYTFNISSSVIPNACSLSNVVIALFLARMESLTESQKFTFEIHPSDTLVQHFSN